MMILFEAQTGAPKCILLEEGILTDFRTAAAGAVAAKYLANKDSKNVLVAGTGNQAKLQVEFLLKIFPIKNLFIWGRSEGKARAYCDYLLNKHISVNLQIIKNIEEAENLDMDILITTTPSRKPLISNKLIKRGIHINAIGADMSGKQELDERIIPTAKVVTDSTAQCAKSGDLQHALKSGIIKLDEVYGELGEIISKRKVGRENPDEITIFDSTGLGVQDLAIANYVFDKYCDMKKIK